MPSRRASATVIDVAIAAGVAVLVCVELLAHWDDGYSAGSNLLNLPLLLGVAATLSIRRRHPRAATAIAYLLVLVPSLLVAHTIFFFGTLLPLLLITYTDARLLATRRWLPTLAAPVLVLLVVPLHQPQFDAADYLFWSVLSAIAIGMGRLMRRLDRQRAALASALAEQVQGQDARERALLLAERARIARELHDIVAHAVSVMVVQAGAARLAVGSDDDEALEGLVAIEQTGREALVDLRRLLGVLRPDDDDVAAPAAPPPGLGALDELIARMRSAGLQVRVQQSGTPLPVAAGLDLSAYRIVQEALTNVLKHCGPTRVEVALSYGADLRIQIRDDGPCRDRRPRPAQSQGGHGLLGLRERTAMFGGSFAAGPVENGWRVEASLPLAGADPALEPA